MNVTLINTDPEHRREADLFLDRGITARVR
jgi:hypothetical protein